MDDKHQHIQDLKMLINREEENYKIALTKRVDFDTLKEIRLHIRKMKEDLQVLLDNNSIKTGELPGSSTLPATKRAKFFFVCLNATVAYCCKNGTG